MRAAAQARRYARVQRDRPRVPVGDRALPAKAAVGARETALCGRIRAGKHEQAHHLDPLLPSARILSGVQARIHTAPLSRPVPVRTAALPGLAARASPTVARSPLAPGPTPGRVAVAAQHRRSLSDRDEQTLEPNAWPLPPR